MEVIAPGFSKMDYVVLPGMGRGHDRKPYNDESINSALDGPDLLSEQ